MKSQAVQQAGELEHEHPGGRKGEAVEGIEVRVRVRVIRVRVSKGKYVRNESLG